MAAQQGININISGDSKDAVAAFTKVVTVLDRLEKETRDTEKATKGAGKATKKTTSEFTKFFKAGVAAGAGLATLNAGLKSIKKVLSSVTNFLKKSTFEVAKAGDQFAKQGRVLGVTSEEYQGLEFAAQRTGTTVKHIADGFKKLSRVMLDAQNGSQQIVRTFGALGVELKTTEGDLRRPLEVFEDLADKFRLMGISAERGGASMLLLGRSGTHLLNLMSEGGKAVKRYRERLEELGAVMSDEDTMAAEKLVDDMTELNFGVKGITYTLAHEFMPAMSGATVALREMLVETNKSGQVAGMAKDFRAFATEFLIPFAGTMLSTAISVTGSISYVFNGAIYWWQRARLELKKIRAQMRRDVQEEMELFVPEKLQGLAKRMPGLGSILGDVGYDIESVTTELGALGREFEKNTAFSAKLTQQASEMAASFVDTFASAVGWTGELTEGTAGLTDAEEKLGAALRKLLVEYGVLDGAGKKLLKTQEMLIGDKFNNAREKERDLLRDITREVEIRYETEREGIERVRAEELKKVEAARAALLLGGEGGEDGELSLADKRLYAEAKYNIELDYSNKILELRAREEAAAREAALNTASAWSDALGATSAMFGALSELIIAGYGEETAEARRAARTMFLIQQSLALGQAILSMAVAIGKANELGYPMAIPAMVAAGATGAVQIATIVGTTIQGVGDAGIPPDALKQAGLNQHSLIAMRNDEMILDPVGTRHISEMLEMQKSGANGATEQVINTTVEIDGEVLGSTVDKRLIRQQERGLAYTNRVRQGYTVI